MFSSSFTSNPMQKKVATGYLPVSWGGTVHTVYITDHLSGASDRTRAPEKGRCSATTIY